MTNTAYGVPLFGGAEWNSIWMWTSLGALLAITILGAGQKLRQPLTDRRARRTEMKRRHAALRELASADFSATQAMSLAEGILNNNHDGNDAFWSSIAVTPLAGMLYAASGRGNGGGLGWVAGMAAAFDDPTPAAGPGAAAAAIPDQHALFTRTLARLDGLDPRRRASVGKVIRSAVEAQMGSMAA